MPFESHIHHARALILYGAGAYTKRVINTLMDIPGWQIAGLIDVDPHRPVASLLGCAVLGGDEVLDGLLADGLLNIHVCLENNQARAEASQRLRALGFVLVSIQHPASPLGPLACVGPGAFIPLFSFLGAECVAGEGCILQAYSDVGHGSRLGDFVFLDAGVCTGGDCHIGDFAVVGMGTTILPRIRIGRHAQIGANAVVHKDVPDYAVVEGNPARVVMIKPY